MAAHVIGIGTISPLGCGINSFKSGLEGAIEPLLEDVEIKTPSGIISSKAYRSKVAGLDQFIQKSKLRRIDNFLQMALMASYLAIEDSKVQIEDRTRIGVVFGSGYGPLQTSLNFFDDLIDYGDKCASPTQFANSVHNSLVSNVSISLKLQGPTLTLSSLEMTTASVFSTALSWIETGTVDYVLAGVGDEYSAITGYGANLSGAKEVEDIQPFEFNECTYIPGEGFVAFMLGNLSSEKRYCKIDQVRSGRGNDLAIDQFDAVFLAANGEKEAGKHYLPLKGAGKNFLAYSPLYGGMPVGQGFDVAAAALSLKNKSIYPSPDFSSSSSKGSTISKKILPSEKSSIGCLQYDKDGNHSLISLSS